MMNLDELQTLLDSETLLKTLGFTKDEENTFDFEKMVDFYYDKPVEFAEDFLNFKADKKQQEIMESIRDNKRTAVRSGQGIGKTATISCVIIWYLCTRYNSKIIATAPNITQLYTVLWAEIAKWIQDSILSQFITHTKTRLYMNSYEKSWFAFPKTATTKEGIAGQHADHLLVIADEASGIKDDILETLLGTITGEYNKLLFISNPTRVSGVYYNAFHQNRASFNCIHVNAENSVRVDRENISMIANSYGKDSNVYRIRVTGDFPLQEDDVFIPINLIEHSIVCEAEDKPVGMIDIGCDVARFGSDKSIIGYKVNEKAAFFKKINGQDTMRTAADIVLLGQNLIKEHNYTDKIPIKIDDGGVGGGVVDRLRQIKSSNPDLYWWMEIVPVKFGVRIKNKYYCDSTTYMMNVVKTLLMNTDEEGKPKSVELILPNDTDLVAQLSCRKYVITDDTRIRIESKKDMKARGLPSPDEADCILLLCLPVNRKKLKKGVK